MKQAPYSWEDASYLTQRSLRVPPDAWRNIGNYTSISRTLFYIMNNRKVLKV